MELLSVGWTVVGSENGTLPHGDVIGPNRFMFNLPEHLLFPTFHVWLTEDPVPYTFGLVRVILRFGFQRAQAITNNDIRLATQGITFAPLASANASDTRSPLWLPIVLGDAFIGSQTVGSGNGGALGTLPPKVQLRITTDFFVGFRGTYHVAYSGFVLG